MLERCIFNIDTSLSSLILYTMLKSIVVLLLLLKVFATQNITQDDAATFLKRLGYNISDNAITDLESILIDFQEKNNLHVDGALNEETITLIQSPRCFENMFDENAYTAVSKWNKFNLSWYFPQATSKYLKVSEKAFDIWARSSKFNFTFVRKPIPKPDITITVLRGKHQFRTSCEGTSAYCPHTFDGPGRMLAHAYFPHGTGCRELHIDGDETFNFDMDGSISDDEHTSLLSVLVHEIGHLLGIGHSTDKSAVMFPWYQKNVINLSEDDKMALEGIYGPKRKMYVPIFPTSTTPKVTQPKIHPAIKQTKTSTTIQKSVPPSIHHKVPQKNLCEIQQPAFMFIATAPMFPNYRMYVGHDRFVWKFDLKDMRIPLGPDDIDAYIPHEIKNSTISHIFQNSAGDLIIYIAAHKRCYEAAFPNLNIHDDFDLQLPINAYVNALFQTNSGRIFIFYNNISYIEFNDDFQEVLNRGSISDQFPGLPQNLISAFRYTDGYIYFFTKSTFYKYSEYTRNVINAGPFNWNIFGISCPNDGLMEQLKTLLYKIISFYE